MIGFVALSAAAFAAPLPPTPQQPSISPPGRGSERVHFEVVDGCPMPQMRPQPWARTYAAPAVDEAIVKLLPQFKDSNLGVLFANTLPNALDSTCTHTTHPEDLICPNPLDGKEECLPDTFIVTGDIDAMWQRDSTNQAKPYLRFLKQQRNNDTALTVFFRGLIARQTRNTLLDPYANAFGADSSAQPGSPGDQSMKKGSSTSGYLQAVESKRAYSGEDVDAYAGTGIHERKYELDSLINPLDLATKYWHASSGDTAPFGPKWVSAVELSLATMIEQQASSEEDMSSEDGPPYSFKRSGDTITDSLFKGVGWPAKRTGMVKSAFRASDDAQKFPFNIAENAFAVAVMRQLVPMLATLGHDKLASKTSKLMKEIDVGIQTHGVVTHNGEKVYAYEVDGHGNYYIMDDANLPSLLAMPYYGYTNATDPLYLATRRTILSEANPWWFNGTQTSGVGGPHIGLGNIWPMGLMAQGWTATSDAEVSLMLETLVNSSACSGLMHESFSKDDYADSTRPWFAWANSFFADFVLKVIDERPHLVLKPQQQ